MGFDKATAGDPRRPDAVVPYKRPPPDEDKIDMFANVGMILGTIGLLVKVRIFSFIALAFVASAFVRRKPETELRQIFICGMFAVMGIAMPYLTPRQAPAAPPS